MYKYNDAELKQLLSSIVIVYDTREQKNNHILDYLKSKKVVVINNKLDVGDYTCFIPKNIDLGIVRDTYIPVVIERKNSLDELSGNFAQNRDRFESEMLRANGIKLILMVEDSSGIDGIMGHKYNTQYNEASYLASLFTFQHRYNLYPSFISKANAGKFIYSQLYYATREMILKC